MSHPHPHSKRKREDMEEDDDSSDSLPISKRIHGLNLGSLGATDPRQPGCSDDSLSPIVEAPPIQGALPTGNPNTSHHRPLHSPLNQLQPPHPLHPMCSNNNPSSFSNNNSDIYSPVIPTVNNHHHPQQNLHQQQLYHHNDHSAPSHLQQDFHQRQPGSHQSFHCDQEFEETNRPCGRYSPELGQMDNPHYFMANQRLYEAHRARTERHHQL